MTQNKSPERTKPAPKGGRKRIMVVDDHPMMRAGLAQLINKQADMEVCGEAGSPSDAMGLLATCRPQLILLDLTMKGGSGLEFIKDAKAVDETIPILVISMHDEKVYAERVLRAGARGYIMKEQSSEHLLTAIHRVLEGGIYLSATMSDEILQSMASPKFRNRQSPLQKLTDREFEVFQLIGAGNTTEQIAAELHLSTKTVDAHRAHIKEKLGLDSSTALVHHATQWARKEI